MRKLCWNIFSPICLCNIAFIDKYEENEEKKEDRKVMAKNMLFATLDTTVRKIHLPDKREFLLSDTVGFISKLPHNLVEAFHSTLEEVKFANLLLEVVDYSCISIAY